MYRCEQCGKITSGSPQKIVTKKRQLETGGWQVVEEKQVCPRCYGVLKRAKQIAGQLTHNESLTDAVAVLSEQVKP